MKNNKNRVLIKQNNYKVKNVFKNKNVKKNNDL